MRIAKWIAGLVLALLVSLSLFWRFEQSRETASAIQQFHERLNAGAFDKICEDAFACRTSADLRNGWNSVLQEVRDRGGKFRAVKTSEIKAYKEPPLVRADYVSSFEKTEIREIFILKRLDGRLRIFSFQTVTKEPRPPVP